VEIPLAGKILSVESTIDPTAKLQDTRLGAYCEIATELANLGYLNERGAEFSPSSIKSILA